MRIFSDQRIDFLRSRYSAAPASAPLFGYNTVRDYCESVDSLPELASAQGDLKDVQRPWAVKTILSNVPAGAHLVEIGAGEPLVAQALVDLGFRITVVDPYDGSGLGPTSFDEFQRNFPDITFVRSIFGRGVLGGGAAPVAGVYSVSVLEHVDEAGLSSIFAGIDEILGPGGLSVHCYDYIVKGVGSEYNQGLVDPIASEQCRIHGCDPLRGTSVYRRALDGMQSDLDAYYLSAAGHNLWRGATPYEEFPYRRVASFTTIAKRSA